MKSACAISRHATTDLGRPVPYSLFPRYITYQYENTNSVSRMSALMSAKRIQVIIFINCLPPLEHSRNMVGMAHALWIGGMDKSGSLYTVD